MMLLLLAAIALGAPGQKRVEPGPPPPIQMPTPAAPPQDEGTRPYGTVAGWRIRIDDSMDKICFLLRRFDDNILLRITPRPDGMRGAWLMIGSVDWKSLRDHEKYQLTMRFDGQQPRQVEATAIRLEDDLAIYLSLMIEDDFFADFIAHRSLELSWNGRSVARLPLDGAREVERARAQCRDEVEATRDPFKTDAPVRPTPPEPAPTPLPAPARPSPPADRDGYVVDAG